MLTTSMEVVTASASSAFSGCFQWKTQRRQLLLVSLETSFISWMYCSTSWSPAWMKGAICSSAFAQGGRGAGMGLGGKLWILPALPAGSRQLLCLYAGTL